MSKTVEFVSKVDDESTDRGYQFTFHCDKCGKGFTSTFRPAKAGMAAGLLKSASRVGGMFGDIFGKASQGAEDVQQTVGDQGRRTAYEAAVEETKAQFQHCTRCGKWVCVAACWNADKGLCEACAPNVTEELVAKREQARVTQIQEAIIREDLIKDVDVTAPARVVKCAKCGADISAGAKFCGGCGAPVAQSLQASHCIHCGGELKGGKFCPQCGKPVR